MVMGIRASLDSVAFYVKNNCTEEEAQRIIRLIGSAMAGTIDISEALYKEQPDIVPRELKPDRH
jgi:hypothetical protein